MQVNINACFAHVETNYVYILACLQQRALLTYLRMFDRDDCPGKSYIEACHEQA